jgi:hypothetical protein
MKLRNIAGLVLAAGLVGTALSGSLAEAATPVIAVTHVTDRPDSGNGAGTDWADDTFDRSLTLTVDTTAGACGTMPSPDDTCYLGTVADLGTFTTIPGRGAPNQNSPATGSDATITSAVTGKMSGTASYSFYASASPSAALVPATVNDEGTAPSGVTLGTDADTSDWYKLAFPAGTTFGGLGIGANSWSYSTACESWTDSSTNNYGNNTNDGNITGKVCPPPLPVISGAGDVINKFGNGLDVYRQGDTVNTRIIAYPVTTTDPAVQFNTIYLGKYVVFEYAPKGVDTGLCVSLAKGSEPKGSAETGLVLRGCFTPWEVFRIVTEPNGSFQLVNVATGLTVQPNGTKAQFTGVSGSTAAGSYFGWNTPGAVPAS